MPLDVRHPEKVYPAASKCRTSPILDFYQGEAHDIDMMIITKTAFLLICSNIFMTFAWYGHLKNLNDKKWYVAALISWAIALFEYLLQVPADRIGFTELDLPKLKILQEVITLSVFVPFVVLYMREPIKLDYLWAGLCLIGAVYFIFRA